MTEALRNGLELARYRIVSRLGAGGMGEVYEAYDPSLERSIALKILPPEMMSDPERVRRFAQEARAASALDHPHIVAIHEVGEARVMLVEGAEPTPVHYIAMELVRGTTLRAKIRNEKTKLRDRVRWLAQAADAVAKAHAAGIVHRDLKPQNVMVTDDGYAKVLDFGLAKLVESGDANSDATTRARDLTTEGVVLGTVGYMAPEQVEGRAVDYRTDIFSFGCMLYEAATGERPFRGAKSVDVMHEILHATPVPIEEKNPAVPRPLRRLIRRCLEKDPDRRVQSMKDLAFELGEMVEDWENLSGSGAVPFGPGTRPDHGAGWRWKIGAAILVAVACTAIAGLVAMKMLRASSKPLLADGARFDLTAPPAVDIRALSAADTLAISRDGKLVAFMGTDQSQPIYLRSIDEVDATLFAHGNGPFFSPDGRWLGYFSEGRIWKKPVVGGDATPICEASGLRGASWGERNEILFSTFDELLSVSADGGTPRVVSSPPAGPRKVRYLWPEILPGGHAALVSIHNSVLEQERKIGVVSLDTGEVKTLLVNGTSPRLTSNGYLIFCRSQTLYAAPFDPRTSRLLAEPLPVLKDVFTWLGSGFAAFGVSQSGSLVYVPGRTVFGRPSAGFFSIEARILWVDRRGNTEAAVLEDGPYASVALSPDGERLAAGVLGDRPNVSIYDLRRKSWRRLPGEAWDGPVLWSPDGKWIFTEAVRDGALDVVRMAADGTGDRAWLTSGKGWYFATGISPDGQTVLFRQVAPSGKWDITVSSSSGGDPRPFLATAFNEGDGTFSPDGRWVAYDSDETGTGQVHVVPYPEGTPRTTVSTEGGGAPLWGHDGRELFFGCGTSFCRVTVRTGPGGLSFGRPEKLFDRQIPGGDKSSIDQVRGVSADGSRFLMIRALPSGFAKAKLVYVPNWTAELDRIYREGGIR